MSNYSNMLAQVDSQLESVEVSDSSGYQGFPEGNYTVGITAARVGGAPWESDDVYLHVEFMAEGKTDDTYIKLTNLTTPQLGGIKKAMMGLGYTGPLAELETTGTEQMVGNTVEMAVKKNGKYTNYYFNKCLGKDAQVVEDDIWP